MLTRLNLCTKEELMKDLKYGRDIGFVEMAEGLSGKVEKLKNGRMEKVIEVADGEQVVIREEEFLAAGFNSVRILVGAGACVTYMCARNVTDDALLVVDRVAEVGAGATLFWCGVSAVVGGAFLQSGVETRLIGEGARVEYKVGIKAEDLARVDVLHRVEHLAKKTVSKISTRVTVNDVAKVVARDVVVIGAGIAGCDAAQESKVLLLAKSAQCHAVPQLEIATDNVSAKHSSSISRLDESQIFSLMSRGVQREIAREIIVEGFFIGYEQL